MKAQDIMTRDPSCVTPNATVRDAARLMKQEDVGIVPAVESVARKGDSDKAGDTLTDISEPSNRHSQ